MDSLDVNKGIAAVLVAGIAFFITGLLGDNLIYEQLPAKPAIAVQVAPEAAGGAPKAPAGPAPIVPLLASADVQKGDTFVHRVCTACHTFNKGGKPLIGPNLYGVVGGPHDHESGFDYSAALEKFKGQPWTYEQLNKWLFDPQTYAPGTHMTYTGIKNTQQRADVIAYLRTLAQTPDPLPAPAPPAKAAQTAPAPAAKAAPTAPAPAAKAGATAPAPGTAAPAGNHSAMGTAAAPNSAPASSPKTIGPPGNSYNASQQAPNAGTQAGGTGAVPPKAEPAKPESTPPAPAKP